MDEEHKKETAPLNWDSLSVLIIDDSAQMRKITKSMLLELGITKIFEAQSAEDAVKLVEPAENAADIILCDWNMPGMSGVEFLQQRRSALSAHIFLMVTSRDDINSIREAIMKGINGYIVKPFTADDLKRNIEKALQIKAGEG